MTSQFSLFDLAPASPTPKRNPARSASTAKRSLTEYERLRVAYASLVQDWEAGQYNLQEVESLIRTGNQGKVDWRTIEAAYQFGAIDMEYVADVRPDGQWNLKVRRWLRHLRRYLCRQQIEQAITLERLKARMLELSAATGVAA